MSSQNEKNFEKFLKQLKGLNADLDDSAKRVVSKMANAGMSITKKNTPVGQYEDKQGGTLRRGWLKVASYKTAQGYSGGYTNNVHYGLYVNNGHRIVRKGVTVGYVQGKRMLEQGMNEVRRQTHNLFEQEIKRTKNKTGF